jgi:hypothetical protein
MKRWLLVSCKFGNEAGGILPNMLVILGSLFLPFASRMASQAKEVEMLSTEELPRNQQLISQIYSLTGHTWPRLPQHIPVIRCGGYQCTKGAE